MSQEMCVAKARESATDPWVPVTLFGQLFLANRGLMESLVAAAQKRYPAIEYIIAAAEGMAEPYVRRYSSVGGKHFSVWDCDFNART